MLILNFKIYFAIVLLSFFYSCRSDDFSTACDLNVLLALDDYERTHDPSLLTIAIIARNECNDDTRFEKLIKSLHL
ncbi:hypothetical protein DLM75_23800 [Leptospira stimsonii]|uniref:Lipoprotein n=1 Tax=Leptospira stimsonii TaxID=2202203 RepID=A0A396YKD2_9LEPT|nr:hypothetical protein DLM75_23800 [Leptospira stimsonii]